MKFSDVVGHGTIKDQLVKDADAGRVPHALLLQGGCGSGVLPLAIAFAQYMHCEHPVDGDSCGVCKSCYQIARLEHPDVHFVFPVNKSVYASGFSPNGDLTSDSLIGKWREMVLQVSRPAGYFTERDWYDRIELGKNAQGSISRGEATEIIRKLSFKSFEKGYKTVIVWLSERMHDTAANALLKLFEEPAENTLFLLIAEDSEAILKTILSRTRLIRVPPVGREDMQQFLESRYPGSGSGDAVARTGGGDVIRSVGMMENRDADRENFELFASLMRLCYHVDHLGLIQWAENIALLPRESQKDFQGYALNMIRESFIKSLGLNDLSYVYGKEEQFLQNFAPYIHYKNTESLIGELEKAGTHIHQNGNPKIVWTHFALSVSKLIYKL